MPKSRSWFVERRLDYIDLCMVTKQQIRRVDIMSAFDVSLPQASADLSLFQSLYKRAIVYDKSAKCYIPPTTIRN